MQEQPPTPPEHPAHAHPPHEMPGMPPIPIESDQYEFSPEQDDKITALAASQGLFGMIVLGVGLLVAIRLAMRLVQWGLGRSPFVPELFLLIFFVLLLFPLGACLIRSARSFDLIVRTRGRDIDHLMNAVTELTRFFSPLVFLYVLLALAGVVFLVLEIIGVVGTTLPAR